MRRFPVIGLAMAALVLLPAPAAADDLIATVARPTPVSAIEGRIVWSDYDTVTARYHLTQRLDGVTSRLPVAPRVVPFDVDLGPDVDGKPVAAYSRCRREPPPRSAPRGLLAQLPQWRLGRGCDLFMYSFERGTEVRVRFAGTRGASEFLPTVWTDRIAFARVYERRKGPASRRAYLYVRPNTLFDSQGRRGHTRRVPAGPRSGPGPTSLDLATRRLAFGWDFRDPRPASSVFLDVLRSTGRTAQRRLDYGHSGEMQSRQFIGPQFDDQVRVVWLASFSGDRLESLVRRWTFMTETREEARLEPAPPDAVRRPAIAGAVDGSGYLYLASGLTEAGVQCTMPAPRRADPGCSTVQPCLLLRAPAPVFGPGRSARALDIPPGM
jgi:hypothetical protein